MENKDFGKSNNPKKQHDSERRHHSGSVAETIKPLCSICGTDATLNCRRCPNKAFCSNCSQTWHKHRERKTHNSDDITQLDSTERPIKQNDLSDIAMHNCQVSFRVSLVNDFNSNQKIETLKNTNNNCALDHNTFGSSIESAAQWMWICDRCTSINVCQDEKSRKICTVCSCTSDFPVSWQETRENENMKTEKDDSGENEENDDASVQFHTAPSSIVSDDISDDVVKEEQLNDDIVKDEQLIVDHQDYRSRFVDEYDEIEREKKEAKARYEASLLTSSPEKLQSQRPLRGAGNEEFGPKTTTSLPHNASLTKMRFLQEMEEDGRAVVQAMKAAEINGYLEDELECILDLSEFTQPLSYMKNQWNQKIRTVQELLEADELPCSYWLGLDSIRLALAKCNGSVNEALMVCAKNWREQIDDLWSLCYQLDPTARSLDHVTAILNQFSGDFEAAKYHLISKLFLERIWGNESVDVGLNDADEDQKTKSCLDDELARRLQDISLEAERRLRMILVEADLAGWRRAEMVLELLQLFSRMESDVSLADIVEAVKSYGNVKECQDRYLQLECRICTGKFPQRKIQTLGCCECQICRDCLKVHFEIVIRERHVSDLVCPNCQLPDFDIVDNSQGIMVHFQFLDMFLSPLLSAEDFELLQTKWRDWNLMQDPSFVWCAFNDCKFGFLVDAVLNKVQCPNCQRFMCKSCKKQWEDQHQDLSCEAFNEWKIANDPEQQMLGLARHLEENGIECPRCNSRYSIARGGCMHFTCGQCRHEFCSGCLQPFKRENTCKQYKRCASMGMHSHHPRDCLYYLKEKSIAKLQQLLQDSNIAHDSENSGVENNGACSVMIQRLAPDGAKDEPCGNEVSPNSAGLCEMHYKEYLVSLINKNGIDPIPIMDVDDLICVLERTDKQAPAKDDGETDDAYQNKVIQMVRNLIPLERQAKPKPVAAAAAVGNDDINQN